MYDTIDNCIKRFQEGQAVNTKVLIRLLEELKLRRSLDKDLQQSVNNMKLRIDDVVGK